MEQGYLNENVETSKHVILISVSMTGQPSNESELQLFRVLQRAKLLSYYDTFIAQGKKSLQKYLVVK